MQSSNGESEPDADEIVMHPAIVTPVKCGPTWTDIGLWVLIPLLPVLTYGYMAQDAKRKVAQAHLDIAKVERAACDTQIAKLSPKAIEAAKDVAETAKEAAETAVQAATVAKEATKKVGGK